MARNLGEWMMGLKPSYTSRGFARYDFKDWNGDACSLQMSSAIASVTRDGDTIDVECIWLGCDHETIHHVTGERCGARMHLTREQVAALLPILQRFVDSGEIDP